VALRHNRFFSSTKNAIDAAFSLSLSCETDLHPLAQSVPAAWWAAL